MSKGLPGPDATMPPTRGGIDLAEGEGFEPSEACTSHAFEACPFGRSGILPPGRLAVPLRRSTGDLTAGNSATRRQCCSRSVKKLKKQRGNADNLSVNVDLFGDEGAAPPRPAWQVIEAARRQYLTGELTLPTRPATHVYLRDGEVYFAERSTDGGLGVRLLVEGVITRQQLQQGTLLVSGAEHLGRLFERDSSIERGPVELCVELMTDEVLVAVAEEVVGDYEMVLYRRHPSGIDRWLPRKVEVVTRLLEHAGQAEDGETVLPPQPRPAPQTLRAEAPAPPIAQVAAEPAEPAMAAEPVTAPASEPEPTTGSVPTTAPDAAPDPLSVLMAVTATGSTPAVEPATTPPEAPAVAAEASAPNPATGNQPVFAPIPPVGGVSLAPFAMERPSELLDPTAMLTPQAILDTPPDDGESGISLAHSAVEAIMSTTIAAEVAEAVRRALNAIDAVATPVPQVTADDLVAPHPAEA